MIQKDRTFSNLGEELATSTDDVHASGGHMAHYGMLLLVLGDK
jgi:hypothetical protein